ncbi:AMP-binding protein [Streptomyces sp. NBC_00932]|uniref:AMP-binding protein n=1 Tax=Streptomyces sp. NBC_00932 TaxID=2903690 RepID=UPI003868CBC7|nr:AMP-binding protein [Streptomyces sp. NBC_00932]
MTQQPYHQAGDAGEFLHDFLLRAVGTTPDRPAVVESPRPGQTTVTTYGELGSLVHTYTAALEELGIETGARVILEAETTALSVAMFLACSRAGLTFIPVSPEMPGRRLLSIIATARPALHLQAADGERADIPHEVGAARFGPGGLAVERMPDWRTPRRRTPCVTDPAYIIFTSGTTGRPKGVVMSHRAVVAFYRGMLAHRLATPEDRIASTSPLQFDFSLLNIGLALGSGASVVPVPPRLVRWPRHFLRVLRETGATQVNGVPSIWRQALRYEPARLAALQGLRRVLFCGEVFPPAELRRLQELLTRAEFTNCYGSTESMACSFEPVPRPLPETADQLSIGIAHPGAELLLVDGTGEIVEEPGVPGELHLRSPALFTGYWDDPVATRAALVPDPLSPQSGQLVLRTGDLGVRGKDGEFYFCGRTDSQVQINGNRVELGEVEQQLQAYPGVTAAAVLALPGPDGGQHLTAFTVPATRRTSTDGSHGEANAWDAGALRDFCARTLPPYMVPQDFHLVDTLPTTANGKVDRAALAAGVGAVPESGGGSVEGSPGSPDSAGAPDSTGRPPGIPVRAPAVLRGCGR